MIELYQTTTGDADIVLRKNGDLYELDMVEGSWSASSYTETQLIQWTTYDRQTAAQGEMDKFIYEYFGAERIAVAVLERL